MIKRTFFFILFLTFSTVIVQAHKFYTSLTQIEYNPQNKSAEVIINLFTDDMETALSRQFNRKIKSTDADFNKYCYQYLDKKFQITDSKNQVLKNHYVGIELKRDMLSLYLEVKTSKGLNNMRLKQQSLMEISDDQNNIVNIKDGKSKTSLMFKANDSASKEIVLAK
ncbi:DUF6702 family protein [Daejeonella oryzae]|uniref:DUF6702 family protein n=1 Tax=Daejeonella oryzae TaxID=1122943 RepID=UPI000478A0B7|nr:DUF6702 family protein [Daejeonella oryzae]